jgi:hypothetical protein
LVVLDKKQEEGEEDDDVDGEKVEEDFKRMGRRRGRGRGRRKRKVM